MIFPLYVMLTIVLSLWVRTSKESAEAGFATATVMVGAAILAWALWWVVARGRGY